MAVNKGFHRVRERKQSTFDRMVPQYFLNSKGQLEESPIQKDTQELINSVEYTRLDEIYDRMLDINNELHYQFNGGDMVVEREAVEDDLSRLLELDDIKSRYAQDNPEVMGMSHSEMLKYVNSKLDKANQKIKEYKENKNNEETPPKPKSE